MEGYKNVAVTCATPMDALRLQYLALCCHLTNTPLYVRTSPECDRSVDLRWPAELDADSVIRSAYPPVAIERINGFEGPVDWPPPEALRVQVLNRLKPC